ncbi:MAG: hypothetical protein OXQ89_14085 [Rhodospirillaceae bacterium]|nr:hypothetical protein [Rhodospirillaceae bacterium]MDE0359876.1 hypothetical protein [Rhodospirillaceae bacterium]
MTGNATQRLRARIPFAASALLLACGTFFANAAGAQTSLSCEAGTIRTLAGTGVDGYGGDGGPATEAQLYRPIGVAVDAAGNVYVAERENDRVRRIALDGTIETFAGTGEFGYGGDGGPATAAELGEPSDVAVDSAGNVYVADQSNHRIRRIAPDGTISTIAGDGVEGYGGDSGPATAAQLNRPVGVAVDLAGNVYVAEIEGHRVRRIAPDGTIVTIAGTGVAGFSGDGGPATAAQLNQPVRVAVDAAGHVYIADLDNHRIRRIAPDGTISTFAGVGVEGYGGDGGPATAAQLDEPAGLALDAAGNLYVADSGNNRVRRIGLDRTISTYAGTGVEGYGGDGGPATAAQLNGPIGVALDAAGRVYFTDTGNVRVRMVGPDTRCAGTPLTLGVAAAGLIQTADEADLYRLELTEPTSVAIYTTGTLDTVGSVRDNFGQPLVSNDDGGEGYNFHIEAEWPAGLYFIRVESYGIGTGPYRLHVRRFADVKLGDAGETVRLWAIAFGGWTLDDSTDAPFASGDEAAASNGDRYVLTLGLDGVWRASPVAPVLFSCEAGTIRTLAGTGVDGYGGDGGPATEAQLYRPIGVAVDAAGNVYVAERENDRVRRIALDGTIETFAGTGEFGYGGDGGPATAAELGEPSDVAVDSAGNVYVADQSNHRIRRIAPDGTISTIAGDGVEGYGGDSGPATAAQLNRPVGVAVDLAGNVYVAEIEGHRVRRIAPDGTIVTIAGTGVAGFSGDGGPATAAQLNQPVRVAVDAAGHVYIADLDNHRIRRIAPDGTISTFAGVGVEGYGGDGGPATAAQLDEPAGLALDAAGNLYVADSGNNRVRRIGLDRTISTYAGTGVEGYGGDGGPATAAQLNGPIGVALDAAGSLYFTDTGNVRVRVVDPPAGDHGDSAACATLLTLGTPMPGRIEDGADEDWFRLELTEPASVAIYTTGALDTVGSVISSGEPILSKDDGGEGYNFHIEADWPAGVYYIRVESYGMGAGPYRLHARRFADVKLGDTGETVRLWATADDGWTLDRVTDAPFANGGEVAVSNGARYVLTLGADGIWTASAVTSPVGSCDAPGQWTIDTFAGTGLVADIGDGGPATEAAFNRPSGVAVNAAGYVYIADGLNHRIRRIAPDGTIGTFAGTGASGYGGDGGPATQALLNWPNGVAVDTAGNVYVADYVNNRIRRIAQDGTIGTFAGSGQPGSSGDGGPATQARLNWPSGVAVDAAGNVYVAEYVGNRIRRIRADGTIETLAGTGQSGFNGDGGPATEAQINSPFGVAVDRVGNVYIADQNNHRIRRIAPDGIMDTVAGTGSAGFGGDGGPATEAALNRPSGVAVDAAGRVYVADAGNNRVRRFVPGEIIETIAGTGSAGFGGDGGPAELAQLDDPFGVAVDAGGNVFVADADNHRIRVLDAPADDHGDAPACATVLQLGAPVPGEIETNDDADWFRLELSEAASVAIYTTGDVDTVGSLRGESGTQITSNDDGGDGSNFHIESDLAIGAYYIRVVPYEHPSVQGRVQTAEFGGGLYTLHTRRFADVPLRESGGETVRLWGTATGGWTLDRATDAPFASGGDVMASDGVRFTLILGSGGVWTASPAVEMCEASLAGTIRTLGGMAGLAGYAGDGGFAVDARLDGPFDVAVDAGGNVFVAELFNHRIRKIGPDGIVVTFAGTGAAGFSGDGGPSTAADLNSPVGVAVDAAGYVYVADRLNHRVRRIATDGTIETIAGTGTDDYSGDGGPATEAELDQPSGVAVDTAGNVYVADSQNHRIRRIGLGGTIETIAGTGTDGYSGDGGPATQARLNSPFDVAVDAMGSVYVADTFNHRIRRIGTDGTIVTVAGTGMGGYGGDGGPATEALLNNPTGVAVTGAGYVFVADWGNDRIRRIAPDGTIVTFAGTGVEGYGGDGGAAVQAQLLDPSGVTVDAMGRAYIADTSSHRVRVVDLAEGCR